MKAENVYVHVHTVQCYADTVGVRETPNIVQHSTKNGYGNENKSNRLR